MRTIKITQTKVTQALVAAFAACCLSLIACFTAAAAPAPRIAVPKVTAELVEAADLPRALTIDQAKFLVHSGFFVDSVPVVLEKNKIHQDDLIDLYESLRLNYPKTARFITADLTFHAFNLYANRAFQKLENYVLIQRAADLLAAMRDSLSRMALRPDDFKPELDSNLARAALTRVHDFISLGLYLISGGPDGSESLPIQADVREFAQKILAGSGTGTNPFTGALQNFSEFKPTGHYARNTATRAYFQTLKLLATEWPVALSAQSRTDENTLTAYAAAIVLEKILNDQRVNARWHALCDPISDITGAIAKNLTSVTSNSRNSRARARSFAVLPKNLTFDNSVFASLTEPNVHGRAMPDVLDVLATFGSLAAKLEVSDYARDYQSALSRATAVMRDLTANTSEKASANVYTDVLRALRAYITANGPKAANGAKQYFAKQGVWEYKKMTTGAAVLAELRQDTAPLFARDFAPLVLTIKAPVTAPAAIQKSEIPCGYVEPVPETFTVLSVAANHLADVLSANGLSGDSMSGEPEYWIKQLDMFAQQMNALADIATRAKSDTMTQSDFEYIKNFTLPRVLPEGFGEPSSESARNALRIPRIATLSQSSPAPFVATGAPLRMLVCVNDNSGGFRVTEGYMLSFFSYASSSTGGAVSNDPDNREQKWREQVYAPWQIDSEQRGPVPPELERGRPSWFKKLYF